MMKNGFPYVNILGVKITVAEGKEVFEKICCNLKEFSGGYICFSNVHTTIMSYDDETYKTVQNSSIYSLPDGNPLSNYMKRNGFSEANRVTGPDFMVQSFTETNGKEFRHYFYGGSEELLGRMIQRVKKDYPELKIAGYYSPPFRELIPEEDERIIQMINDAHADFVWVCLGAPKQEKWMYEHKNKIHGVMFGVGAAFQYFVGDIARAPEWMQKYSLEWLYRLVQEPKRLFKRYFYTNLKYVLLIYGPFGKRRKKRNG